MRLAHRLKTTVNGRLALLLFLYLIAAGRYNVATPIYEAPDEYGHFALALWLRDHRRLPVIPEDLPDVSHEMGQPPLYYIMVALAIAPIDSSDFKEVAPFNTHWLDGGGRPVYYHDSREAFPYSGTTLAVHVARLVSTLLGGVTVFLSYKLAHLIIPQDALLAAALVALNPQFTFMSGTLNNDNLVTTAVTAALYLAVWIYHREKTSPIWYLSLGLITGAAALSKLSGLGLGVVMAWLLLAQWIGTRKKRIAPFLWRGMLLAAGFGLAAGWWFWRNYSLYGDPLAWNELLYLNQQMIRAEPFTLMQTLHYSYPLKNSFWLLFAHGIRAPQPFYVGIDIILILSVMGAGLGLARGQLGSQMPARRASVWLMPLWIGISYLMLMRWMRLAEFSNHGRFLFPAISAVAILLALGLGQYRRFGRLIPRAALTFLGSWAMLGAMLLVGPEYATPEPLGEEFTPPNPSRIEVGESMELLGFDLKSDRWEVGEQVSLDLYWRAVEKMDTSYMLAPRIIDSENRVVSAHDIVPSDGRYPTPTWVPGDRFAENHTMPAIATGAAPGVARLILIVYPFGSPESPVPVVNDDGSVSSSIFLAFGKITGRMDVGMANSPALVTFGSVADLVGAAIMAQTTERVVVTLAWRALRPDGQDYHVFVHLINAQGELVSQADGPPGEGRFPTFIWDPGDVITGEWDLALPAGLPAGEYFLRFGLYRLQEGERLTALDPDGMVWPDDAAELLSIEIE